MLPQIFIFLIFSSIVACDTGDWSDGDNWIASSLKASSIFNQLSSSQRDQLENIVDNDQLTEAQIMVQVNQFGNNQLQGDQKQMFLQWDRQLAVNRQQFLQHARVTFNGLSSQAQPYGRQILQELQKQDITPEQKNDQVNNIIRNTPTDIRNELLNAFNKLEQYRLQQQNKQLSSSSVGFNNDFRTMGTGYSSGYEPQRNGNGFGYNNGNNGYSGGYGNTEYAQNTRNGYQRSPYGQGQFGNGQGLPYSSQYTQNPYQTSRHNNQYSNDYNTDSTGFPLPPGLGRYTANTGYGSQYGQQNYAQSSYNRPVYNQGYSNGYAPQQGYSNGYAQQQGYGQNYGNRQSVGSNFGYGQK